MPSAAELRASAQQAGETRDVLMKAQSFSPRGTSAVAPPPDEADKAFEGVGAVMPPYEPFVLLSLLEHSNSLRQCVDAYVTNIDAFGHRFEPIIDLGASDADDRVKTYLLGRRGRAAPEVVNDPLRQVAEPTPEEITAAKLELAERMRSELVRVKHFFDYACLDQSFVSLRRNARQDIETLGNAYWEVVRDGEGALAGFEYIPGFTVRHLPADQAATDVRVRIKSDEFSWDNVQTKRYFRRFVQMFETRTIWFKEFGDPRTVSRLTGAYFPSVEALKARDQNDEPASEVLHFKIHTSKSSYGIPRWIGTILSVLGSRQAEEVNLTYFENKSVPPLAVLVSGGRISNSTVERIQSFIDNDIKGKKNFHKILVLEAESPGASSFDQGRMKIELKPLTAAQHNDALFQGYDERNIDKVGQAFRLPRMLRGDIRDFNRATADAALDFSEQQVFKPERDEFDFTINRKILPALGVRFWRFKSNGVTTQNAKDLSEMLKSLGEVGFLTPAEGRDLMEQIFNRPFQKIDAPWVRQPLSLTQNGVVPPDQLMAPGMATTGAAAFGAPPGAPGGAVLQGPAAGAPEPPPLEPEVAGQPTGVKLTGTDIANVITVNEGRESMGLPPLKLKDGGTDPDGFLTIAEFKAKRVKQGEAVGEAVGEARGEAATGNPAPAPEQQKSAASGLHAALAELLTLRKALDLIDQHAAGEAFRQAKAIEDQE